MVCYDRMVPSWETIDIASSIWNRTTRCRLRPGPRWRYLRSRARRHSRRCCWSAGIELRDGGGDVEVRRRIGSFALDRRGASAILSGRQNPGLIVRETGTEWGGGGGVSRGPRLGFQVHDWLWSEVSIHIFKLIIQSEVQLGGWELSPRLCATHGDR